MINLKKTKEQLKKERKGMDHLAQPYSGDEYPWGSRLRFEKPEIDKLDALKKAQAGDQVKIVAVGKVIEVSTSSSENTNGRHSVEVQIQKIEVSGKAKDAPEDEKDAFDE